MRFNCNLGRKKTLSVEMTMAEMVEVITALELTGPTGLLGQHLCTNCLDESKMLHDRLVQMIDVATGGEITRKREP